MASADWTFLNDGLDIGAVDRGVTAGGPTPANGTGNAFVYGFNSLAVVTGAVGLFCNLTNFAPMAKGGSITGLVQRAPSGGPIGFSPFLFMCAQGPSVNDKAYMLGLSDDDPHRIVLKKGTIATGIPTSDAPGVGLLRKSSSTVSVGTWVHLKLDVIVNPNGDVVVNAFQNDLTQRSAAAPSWNQIAGLSQFIDDNIGVNSGSQPFTSGRAGFGYSCSDITRRAYFDYIALLRQV